ncbi:MAG: YegP family protein [Verrucomicrobiota bacterium]
MAAKFILKKSKNGKFHFNLQAGNGQVILQSQMYKDKAGAKNGIKSAQTNCKDEKCFERLESSKKQPYFVLKSKNKQVVGQSQMYKSTSSMNKGIKSVQRCAGGAAIDDQTS